MTQYRNLSWSLSGNTSVSIRSLSQIFKPSYIQYADDIIGLLQSRSVAGLQHKMDDVSDAEKFRSAMSELILASTLSNQGKKVEILPDQPAGWSGKTPDIITTDSKFGKVFVEVKRVSETRVTLHLAKALNRFLAHNPFVVNVELSETLGSRPTTRKGWKKQQSILKKTLNQFKAKFAASKPRMIKTRYARFESVAISGARGYTGAIDFGISKGDWSIRKKMIEDAREKSKKRKSWKSAYPNVPYVVAIDTGTEMLDDVTIDNAFIGANTYIDPKSIPNPLAFKDVSHLTKVVRATSLGWKQYFIDEGLIHSNKNHCCLQPQNIGAFFKSSFLGNVSAVLIMNYDRNFYFRANPFCVQDINNPNFMSFLPRNFKI